VYSQDYLDSSTMLGEVILTLLDWSDEAQEDLILVALNGVVPPTLEAYMHLWDAMRVVIEAQ
jgi:hypothetical protein